MICNALSTSGVAEASKLARQSYPFIQTKPVATRSYTATESLAVFIRDGFVDRYTGRPLVFPAVPHLVPHAARHLSLSPQLENGQDSSGLLGAFSDT